jgi:oligoendopeptidase F
MEWKLGDICPKEKFGELLKEIEKEAGKLPGWWKKLDPGMEGEVFKDYIEFDQSFGQKMARASYLPELLEAINQKDAEARLMKGKIQEVGLAVAKEERKFDRWLKGLPVEGKKTLDDNNAERLFAAVPETHPFGKRGRN